MLLRLSKGHTASVIARLVSCIASIGSIVPSAISVRALKTPIIEFIQINKNAYKMKHIIYTILGLLAPTGLKKWVSTKIPTAKDKPTFTKDNMKDESVASVPPKTSWRPVMLRLTSVKNNTTGINSLRNWKTFLWCGCSCATKGSYAMEHIFNRVSWMVSVTEYFIQKKI